MSEFNPRPPETQAAFDAPPIIFGTMTAIIDGPDGGPWEAMHPDPAAAGNGADPDQNGHDLDGCATGALAAAVASFGVTGDKAERLRLWLKNNLTPEGRFLDKAEMDRRYEAACAVEQATHPGKTSGKDCDVDTYGQANGPGALRQHSDLKDVLGDVVPIERGRLSGPFLKGVAKHGEQIRFPLVAWKDISFDLEEECRVEGVLPLVGLACVYGAPGVVKTFILLDLFARIARGGFWGGREVKQSPVVYIAAEGSGGIKKRIVGLKHVAAEKGLPADIPFHLVTVAPNLGTGDGDCKKLIADVEATSVQPGAIAIDTTTQALAGADENGAGMDTLVVNATALAVHFQCLVVLVHHTPVSDDERLRGKGSLGAGLDASIIIKREKGSMVAALIVKKMRDEDDGQAFTVNLSRVVLGKTKKGREVSTLVVETVEPGAVEGDKAGKKLPTSAANALSAMRYALDEVGAVPPASAHIPANVKCVTIKQWRDYSYMRSGEQTGGGMDQKPDKTDCPVSPSKSSVQDTKTDKPDTRLKTFVRGCERLQAEKIVAIWGSYAWLTK